MSRVPGSGGVTVTKEMQKLLDQPGPLSVAQGGQRLRVLYREESMNWNPMLLNPFAQACYFGALYAVKEAVESGKAPDLSGQETGFKHGYAAITLFGAQRVQYQGGGQAPPDHLGTLRYLLEHGAPADVPDVLGYTALHHATMAYPRADFARVLLEHGADPNWQDRFGSVALIGAFQNNSIDAIEVLMEFGARLDIAEADGYTPESFFVKCGPKVTAVVQKWKRKRAGEANPLDEKVCAMCSKSGRQLKMCSKCHKIWYCSKECQKQDWSRHKRDGCSSSGAEGTLTLIPFYGGDAGPLFSVSDMARGMLGHPVEKRRARNTRSVQVPHIAPGETKKMIIKVQVPVGPSVPGFDDMLVYDKKRSFVCRIRRQENPDGYARLSRIVREKGVAGLKAYFSAEMPAQDALKIKLSEVLPEQAF